MKRYLGKPYPGVKEVEQAAKEFDNRITRKYIEMAEPSVWPEGRPKRGRPWRKQCPKKIMSRAKSRNFDLG